MLRFHSKVTLLALSLLAAACLVVASSVSAEEAVRLRIDQVVNEDGSLTALVSVTDANGAPVPGSTSFETSLSGNSVTPTSVTTSVDDQAGVAVMLLIDVSGSMTGAPIEQARKAASLFIDQLAPNDSVAIVPFGGQPPTRAEFLTDRNALESALASLTTEGNQGTALYDSVVAVSGLAPAAPSPRRALILLTDGRDQAASVASRKDAIASARDGGMPVYTIGLGDADLTFLEELAGAGHGSFYHAPAPEDIAGVLQAIGETLRSRYVITVPLTNFDASSGVLRVQLQTADGAIADSAAFELPAAVSSGGGAPVGLIAFALAAVVTGLAGVFFVIARRRRQRSYETAGAGPVAPLPGRAEAPVSQRPETFGVLSILEGPDQGTQVRVGGKALEIGSSQRCDIRLDAAGGAVAGVHARVWLKDGRLMVHHIARKHETFVGDRSIEWASLEPSDRMRVGPYLFGFSIEPVRTDDVSPAPQPAS